MYAALAAPLPVGAAVETACLARIAQATVLGRRERDNAPVQARTLEAQRDCRRRLIDLWVGRADAATPGDSTTALRPTSGRAEACLPARNHLDALRRLDPAAAAAAERRFLQSCGAGVLALAAEAHREAAPRPIGAGDRTVPTCDRRDRDGTCEVVADGQLKAGTAEASCTRTSGRYSLDAACPTTGLVSACALKTGSTWFAYREGPAGFNDLRARQACEAQGGAFARADALPAPAPVPPVAPAPPAAPGSAGIDAATP